jgi:hypothetical protein
MADYYPLIARAIAGLDPSAPGESRRALYERARAALIAQLRSAEPPLSESEITRERLSLEEAVRKVESEAAKRARDASRPGGGAVARAGDAFRSANARPSLRGFRDMAADADDLGRAAAQASQSARTTAGAPAKRYPDSLQTRSKLADRAAEAKADADRRAEEERLEKLLQIDRATQEQEEIRRQREKQEAARVQKERTDVFARAQLAKVASPAPSLAPDGRLDAGPNPVYDEPNTSDDLPTLPLRQRELIKAILSDLPRNSPTYLKTSLQSYDDELKIRGAQPILGLLKDVFEIIAATVGDPEAQDWLAPGLQKAFEKVAENHHTLISHFPLDPEREDIYAQTLVEENEATGHSLSEPFRHIAEAAHDANKAGLTTEDFVKVVDKMAEFAKIISTLPLSSAQSASPPRSPEIGAHVVVIRPEDRVGGTGQPITSKKRTVLQGLGFFERTYNLLGSSVTIAATPAGLALLHQLQETISALLKFLL